MSERLGGIASGNLSGGARSRGQRGDSDIEAMAAHEADETVRSARAVPDVEECAQQLGQVGARRSAEGAIVRDGAERSDVSSYPRCRACCLRNFHLIPHEKLAQYAPRGGDRVRVARARRHGGW